MSRVAVAPSSTIMTVRPSELLQQQQQQQPVMRKNTAPAAPYRGLFGHLNADWLLHQRMRENTNDEYRNLALESMKY